MNLHILNAQKKLTAHCEWLQINLTDTYAEQRQRLMPIHSLDVVVKAGKFVIPEKGHLGFCPEAGVIYITVDPENLHFAKMMRTLLNECLCMNCTMQLGGQGGIWLNVGRGVSLRRACRAFFY
jgi:hypothetical protein